MADRTITFTLDSGSIRRAINELRKYRNDFVNNCERLRKLIAERIRWTAQQGFDTAIVTDVIYGDDDEPANVRVYVRDQDDVTVVFTEGEKAIFIEFGAGVYYNGAAGTSPHPWGERKGFLIGEYGQGKGKRNAWGYYKDGDKNKLVVTRGTPIAMPMYRGMQTALGVMDDLVREVFRN